jgi:DNA mismatch repair ATPase MutS
LIQQSEKEIIEHHKYKRNRKAMTPEVYNEIRDLKHQIRDLTNVLKKVKETIAEAEKNAQNEENEVITKIKQYVNQF